MTGFASVLLVAYLLIVIALIAVILLQRSEGGALGIGGGSNQFMTARGSANLLTRTTAILATLFFAIAIGLTILAELDRGSQSILDRAQQTQDGNATQPTSVLDALNQLQGDTTGTPAVPAADGAAQPAAPTSTDTPNLAVPAAPAPEATTPAAPIDTAPAATTESTAPATPAAPSDAAPAATPAEPATNGGGQPTTN
ncbi:Preprotein translocase subunit SecG [Devosia sp. DBB001]|nr:Preprotein translocase subunit SecG [Devosia sp. DBB001]